MAMNPTSGLQGSRVRVTRTRVILTLVLHALVIWGLCGATIAIGMNVASLPITLAVHAALAPFIAAFVSFVYFRCFGYTTPLVTASFVVVFVALVDFLLVAVVINRSLAMFRSIIGTWLPFALIFGATYVMGLMNSRCQDRSPR